jgi:hypothetical protein
MSVHAESRQSSQDIQDCRSRGLGVDCLAPVCGVSFELKRQTLGLVGSWDA